MHFLLWKILPFLLECVKVLLSYTLFQPLQDGPYNSANSVNGGNNYPYYFVIKGKTLLHTIVLNTVSESIWDKRTGGIAYRGNAAWERDFDLAPKLGDSSVSMVEGLTGFSADGFRYVKSSNNYFKLNGDGHFTYLGPGGNYGMGIDNLGIWFTMQGNQYSINIDADGTLKATKRSTTNYA